MKIFFVFVECCSCSCHLLVDSAGLLFKTISANWILPLNPDALQDGINKKPSRSFTHFNPHFSIKNSMRWWPLYIEWNRMKRFSFQREHLVLNISTSPPPPWFRVNYINLGEHEIVKSISTYFGQKKIWIKLWINAYTKLCNFSDPWVGLMVFNGDCATCRTRVWASPTPFPSSLDLSITRIKQEIGRNIFSPFYFSFHLEPNTP